MSRSSKKSLASQSRYSSAGDDDLNDRSNLRLSYPTDVKGQNRLSGQDSSAKESGSDFSRLQPVSRFQPSNSTQKKSSANKSMARFLNGGTPKPD